MLLRPVRRMPTQPDLTQVLRGLLDREVVLSKVEPRDVPCYIAVYHDNSDTPVNAITFDVAMAASASASLALVPAGQAEEWVAAGLLSEDARDNTYEVLNVLAATHNGGDEARHVKIAELFSPGDEIPLKVEFGLREATARVCYDVEVPGYPSGYLSTIAF